MMKITGLSHLFKWENLHNWWLTKYFFAPLYLSTGAVGFVVYCVLCLNSICWFVEGLQASETLKFNGHL